MERYVWQVSSASQSSPSWLREERIRRDFCGDCGLFPMVDFARGLYEIQKGVKPKSPRHDVKHQ